MLVAEGTHRLTNGVVNVYVVEEAGALTLIDAGAPGDWETLVATLGSIGRSPGDIETVLLTHGHSDHTGFAERARSEAGATVRVHEADVERATKGTTSKNESGYGRYLLRIEAYRTLFGVMRRGGVKIVAVAEVWGFGG